MDQMNRLPADAAESLSPAMLVRVHAEVLAMVGASTLAGLLVAPRWGTSPVDLLYLPPVLAAAAFYGLRPALVLATGEPAGRGEPRLDPAEWLFHPVRSDTRVLAAMGLARDDGRPAVAEERLPLLANLLDQAALALERAAYEAEARGVAELRERDRLRGALLSSVGHDLRTPLTAILAAAAELRRTPGDEALL